MSSIIREKIRDAILKEKERTIAIIDSEPFPPNSSDKSYYHITLDDFEEWKDRIKDFIKREH